MLQLPVLSEHTSPWLGRTISKPVGSLWASMSILGTGTPLYGRQSLPLREVAGPAKKQMPFLPLPFSSHSWPSGIADLPTRFNYRLREKVVFEFGSLRKKWLTSATGRCAFRRTEGLHGGEAQIISTLCENFQIASRKSWKQDEKWLRNTVHLAKIYGKPSKWLWCTLKYEMLCCIIIWGGELGNWYY